MKILPDDIARCTNVDCSRIEECARHTIHYAGDSEYLPVFCPHEVECEYFIDGGEE
jgi:hypothetical protein